MSDELNVWRDACFAYGGASIEGAELEPKAAAVIRDYGDRRDADAYQRGKMEGARLAIEAAALIAAGSLNTVDAHDRIRAFADHALGADLA